MARPYTITIVDGSAVEPIMDGSYAVTATSTGYDNLSIQPATVDVVDGDNDYPFTISASGELTFHVTEDGTTPLAGATFVRCDSDGNEYGDPITSQADGNVVFPNVPFAASGAPIIYYKQTATADDHAHDDTLQQTTMATSSETVQVINTPAAPRTITLTDINYSGLPIEAATITLA